MQPLTSMGEKTAHQLQPTLPSNCSQSSAHRNPHFHRLFKLSDALSALYSHRHKRGPCCRYAMGPFGAGVNTKRRLGVCVPEVSQTRWKEGVHAACLAPLISCPHAYTHTCRWLHASWRMRHGTNPFVTCMGRASSAPPCTKGTPRRLRCRATSVSHAQTSVCCPGACVHVVNRTG